MALTDKIKAVADAIREKTNTTDSMTLDEMPTKITSIETGGNSDELVKILVEGPTGNFALPNNITKIRDSCFVRCINLGLTSLPS